VTPSYRSAGDSGVETDAERFAAEVWVAGERWGAGVGRSKQAAAEAAARSALEKARRGG
jgi:dsRNA-specific ribonuclease